MPWLVAPFTGAWIEIQCEFGTLLAQRSLPSRERGLKLLILALDVGFAEVAPFTGAWIEIWNQDVRTDVKVSVAPFTGAWIEIG